MDADDLMGMSATALAQAVRQKQVSPVEIIQRLLQKIAEVEPSLNAFSAVTPDAAMQAAREAEAKVMRAEPLGALHGVPFTVKDLFATKQLKTEFGSHLRKGFV